MARTARKTTKRVSAKTALPRARKAAAKPARRTAAAKPARRTAAAKPARRTAAAKPVRRAPAPPVTQPLPEVKASPPGKIDLAGALRSHLAAIDAEVRAVNSLTERIDVLVSELNDVRDQQAKRLLVLDDLRSSVTDQSLGAFLDQVIKSRKPRVPEVVPKRLM